MQLRAVVAGVTIGMILLAVGGCAEGTSSGSGTSSAVSKTIAIDQDFPDPDILSVGTLFYAYATNSAAANVQVATSTDLNSWEVSTTDALPTLPSWSAPKKTWAPDVSQLSSGTFVMYYTAATVDPSLQCINVATSNSPTGPFTTAGSAPLVCPADEGGAIDPASFVDTDGTAYLVWKNDGNCCGLDTWLHIAPLAPDRLTLAGPAIKLLKQTLPWEGSLIEAPTLVKHGSHYLLLYSANDYAGNKYAIGSAVSDGVFGPYVKESRPLLSTASSHRKLVGPGGQDVVSRSDGTTTLVFHSWSDGFAYRSMKVLPLLWSGDVPTVRPE